MRNLKKILALVLAFLMSLSLMATAGAADFPDSDKITNRNYALAADILSDLNVFVGDQNGNFNPDQLITRAEVAAIIYRIGTGDVTNEKNNTYTSYGQFKDVISGDWFEGYVTYCAIAGYIKGRNTGNFDPKDNVTGYEVLAMILRAVGYDKNGEFVGSDWQINTARIARENGILDHITNDSSVQLGEYVTREVVAEMLFQAIQVPQVTWSIVSNTYTKDGLTLAKEHLDMESVTGVVMANEWANINANDDGGDTVLAEGQTELKPEGEPALTLDVGTDLDAVGQTYTAYIQGGTRVLGSSLACSDVNVVAFNDGKSVNVSSLDADETHANSSYDEGYASISALASSQGIKSIADAEYFLDYDLDYSDWDYTEILIRYAVDKDSVDNTTSWKQYRSDVDALKVAGHLKTEVRDIPVNWDPQQDGDDTNNVVQCYVFAIQPEDENGNPTKITGTDKEIMKEIFYTADRLGNNINPDASTTTQNYVYGEVYVGTSSMTDVSDEMSWIKFQETYFLPSDTVNYSGCGNGQSLRVIDNDGDGSAEYIFKVQYWQDEAIAEYDDALEFYSLVPSRNAVWDGGDKDYDVGDVVNYRLIDGKTTIWKAEKITDVIDHKNFQDITVTPANGEPRGQSDIWNMTDMSDDIMYMLDKTEYNMYLDQFGYIRTYELAQGSNYALVTEMYNTNANAYNYINSNTWIAEVKRGEADLEEFIVSNPGTTANPNPFISTYAWTTRVSRYNNASDLNMLQPAIAHLGTAMVTEFYSAANPFVGATRGVQPKYYLTGTGNNWSRGVFEMVAEANTGDYGVFDYGTESYQAYTTAAGTVAAGNAPASFSFTNVAAYGMDGDNIMLTPATQLSYDRNGQQLYRVGYDTSVYPVTGASETVDGSSVPGTKGKDLTFGKVGTKEDLKSWWIADNTDPNTGIVSDGVTSSVTNKAADIADAADEWWALNYSGSTTHNVAKDGTKIYPVYAVDYVQLTKDAVTAGQRHFTINANYSALYNSLSNGYVNAIDDTEIYVVTPSGTTYYKGFASIPAISANYIRAAYAVATNTEANRDGLDYWVADVIVIETEGLAVSYDSISLMYYNPWETTGSVRYVYSLNNRWAGYEAESPDITVVPKTADGGSYTWGFASWSSGEYGFYELYDATDYNAEDNTLTAGQATKITKDWNAHGIYAGTVRRLNSLAGSGYIDVDTLGRDTTKLPQDDSYVQALSYRNVPIYRLTGTSANTIRLTAVNSDVSVGDRLIWVYAHKSTSTLAYIIDLDDANNTRYITPDYLKTIYGLILGKQLADAQGETLEFNLGLSAGETVTFYYDGVKQGTYPTADNPDKGYLTIPSKMALITFEVELSAGASPAAFLDAVSGDWVVVGTPKPSGNTLTVTMANTTVSSAGKAAFAFNRDADGTIFTTAGLTAYISSLTGETDIGTLYTAKTLLAMAAQDGMNSAVKDEASVALISVESDYTTKKGEAVTAATTGADGITNYESAAIDNLSSDDQAVLDTAKIAATAAINNATTQAEIDEAVKTYKDLVDQYVSKQLNETLTGEAKAAAQAAARAEVNAYKDDDKGTEIAALDDDAAVTAAMTAAEAAITAATTQKELNDAVEAYKKAIDAAITLTVTFTAENATVQIKNEDAEYVTGTSTTVTAGGSVSFKVTVESGYALSEVKNGESVIEAVADVYTIADLGADAAITVTTRKMEGQSVSVINPAGAGVASNLTVTPDVAEAVMLNSVELTLKAATGYKLPDDLTAVTVGGVTIPKADSGASPAVTGWSYNNSTGAITFDKVEVLSGDIQIIAAATKVWTISVSGQNIKEYTAVEVDAGTAFTSIGTGGAIGAVQVANANYELPAEITVKQGTTTLVADTDYEWNSSTGVITFKGSKTMTGDITIVVNATAIEIAVTAVTNVTFTPAKFNKGTDLKNQTITVAPDDGYTVSGISAVSVNGSSLTVDSDYEVSDGDTEGTKVVTFLTTQEVTTAIAITVTVTQG